MSKKTFAALADPILHFTAPYPDVEEVAVVGISHPKWVEAVAAVIKLKVGATVTEEEMMAHCKANLSSFKTPKKIIFVDELPKAPTGKILKRDMRESYKNIFPSIRA